MLFSSHPDYNFNSVICLTIVCKGVAIFIGTGALFTSHQSEVIRKVDSGWGYDGKSIKKNYRYLSAYFVACITNHFSS